MVLLYVCLWIFAVYGVAALIHGALERLRDANRVIDEAPIRLDVERAIRNHPASNVRRLPRKVDAR